MNGRQFDALTKAIPVSTTRRRVFSTLLSLLAYRFARPLTTAAQTRCSHKLDCSENEICGIRGCQECPEGDSACPVNGEYEDCQASVGREICPFWYCAHTTSDPDNCGGCGVVCADGTCENGSCSQQQGSVTQPNLDYAPITVEYAGQIVPYQASIEWSPLILPLPNGNAWAIFTAQTELQDGPGLSYNNVFASIFDADLNSWSAATPLPGEISFGPTGAVDDRGIVHLVYSLRAGLGPSSYSMLVYIRTTPSGEWTIPSLIAPSEFAGHQLSADVAIDPTGGLHVAWQDQRAVTADRRAMDASNADVFVSDLNPDGLWTEPVQISDRTVEENNGSRPQLMATADRLVLIWSVYSTTEEIGLDSATHVQWTTRPLSDAQGWAEPQTLFEREATLIGGRFLDADASQDGETAILYGRRATVENQLYVQRLPNGEDTWTQPANVANGEVGSYPRIAFAPDGTLLAVYNDTDFDFAVNVGAFAIAPGSDTSSQRVILTELEEGQQGIASVSVDSSGRVWVIYLQEFPGMIVPTEVRVRVAAAGSL